MTPEQRADAVWQKIIGVEGEMAWFDYEDYLPFIADAFRAVRNEALEEAAKVVEAQKDNVEVPCSYEMAHVCIGIDMSAAAIRALKVD